MRHFTRLAVLFGVALCASAQYGPGESTQGLLNGRFWIKIGAASSPTAHALKILFLEGYIDALHFHDDDFWVLGSTYDEIIKAVDQFYQDPANTAICIRNAIIFFQDRKGGLASPQQLAEALTNMRACAAEADPSNPCAVVVSRKPSKTSVALLAQAKDKKQTHPWFTGVVLDANTELSDPHIAPPHQETVLSLKGADFEYTARYSGLPNVRITLTKQTQSQRCRFIVGKTASYFQERDVLLVVDADGQECRMSIIRQVPLKPSTP